LNGVIACYKKAVELDPQNVRLHVDLLRALSRQGKWDEAIAEYREVIRFKSHALWGYYNLGDMLADREEWEKASAEFLKATECKGANGNTWYKRGMLCLGGGDRDAYRKVCADMLQRFGRADDPDSGYWLAWTCALAPDAVADASRPVQLAEKAVAKEPKNLAYRRTLGAALYRAGRFDEAAKQLTEASTLDPNDPRTAMAYTWFFLALAHHRLGHADEARRWLDKATRATEDALKPLGKSANPAGVIPPPWNRKLTLRLLRREAEELMQRRPTGAQTKSGTK
jgi:tetratricopeptide (TPR) repeat protein